MIDRVALREGFRIADQQCSKYGFALVRRYVKDDFVFYLELKQSDIELAYEDEVRFREIVEKKVREMVV